MIEQSSGTRKCRKCGRKIFKDGYCKHSERWKNYGRYGWKKVFDNWCVSCAGITDESLVGPTASEIVKGRVRPTI